MASQAMIDYLKTVKTGGAPATPSPVVKPTTQLQPTKRNDFLPTKPSDPVSDAVGGVGRTVSAGLGMVGNILNKPSELTEQFLTGGQGYDKKLNELGIQNTKGQLDLNDVLSTAGRFVLDPLNLLGVGVVQKGIKGLELGSKVAKVASKIPGVTKAVEGVTDFAKASPTIKSAIRTVSPFWGQAELGKMAKATEETTSIRLNQLWRQISEATKGLTPAKSARIGQLLEGGVSTAKTESRLVEIANLFKSEAEKVGKELVDTGLIDPKSFEKYKGAYMHHMWNNASEGKSFLEGLQNVPKFSGNTQKLRKGAEGYVKEFQAPTFAGLGSSIQDIEAAKFYKGVGEKFGVKAEPVMDANNLSNSLVNSLLKNKKTLKVNKFDRQIPEGFVYAPEELTKATGGQFLKDVALPQDVVDILTAKIRSNPKGNLEKYYDAAMNFWKKGKTIYNPAYHPRNLVSNQILTELQTGQGIPKTLIDYVKSVRDYFKGSPVVKEAEDIGLIRRKNFGQGVQELLGNTNKKTGVGGFLSKVDEGVSGLQSTMEDTAKLNVFQYFRKQGKTVSEAKDLAEEAIFSPYRISPSERSLIGKAVPFYSFFRQAAPFIAKKLVTHPERFTKYVKAERAIEKASSPDGEQNLPDYMKEMVRTPFKNEKGQPKYLSTQFFYPWGGFIQENNPAIPGVPIGLSINPFLEELYAQKQGVDPYFKTPFVDKTMTGGEEAGARLEHAAQTLLPTAYRTAKKVIPAIQGRPDSQGRQRSLGDLALGEGLGVKLYPFNKEAGAKTKAWEAYDLTQQFKSRINKVARDQSLTTEEKKKEIKRLQEQMRQMLSK